MNFKKSILILALFFFAIMQSQTMVTTSIQSRLLNKYWCPNVGDPYEVVFLFTQNEVTLFVGNKKIGSEPYYITSNTEVTKPTTFDNSKVGLTSSGNCVKTNSSYFIVEFFSDFKSFRWKRSFDPAQIWQTYTQKSTPFFSVAKSGTFTRNNCGTGNVGMVGVYDVEAGKHISYVSPADADAKAQADVNTNGQNVVNGEASVYCIYYSLATTREVRKNDCLTGKVGSKVSYTVPAGRYSSEISEADAALYVDAAFNREGQQFANSNGKCGYINKRRDDYYTKNDCILGRVGSDRIYFRVEEGEFFSPVSQNEADRLALVHSTINGQINANKNGFCVYQNTVQSRLFTKSDCGAGGIGSTFEYIVKAGLYHSKDSQADANNKAIGEINQMGQINTNARVTCTYKNTAISRVYSKAGCTLPRTGINVTYTVLAGTYSSTLSQDDATKKALNDVLAKGQSFANANGTCVFKSKALTNIGFKRACISPKVGANVFYSALAGAFTSPVSQTAADALAQKAGQDNANLKGTCN